MLQRAMFSVAPPTEIPDNQRRHLIIGDLYGMRLRIAQSFNRVGNAPRFVFQISNTKFQIEQSRPAGHAVKRANANRVQ